MTCFILNHTIKKNNVAAIFWDESDDDTQILLEYNLLSFINTIFKFSYQIHTIISLLPHAWCFKSNFLKKEKIQYFYTSFLVYTTSEPRISIHSFQSLKQLPKISIFIRCLNVTQIEFNRPHSFTMNLMQYQWKTYPVLHIRKKSTYSHLYGCDHDSLKSKAVMIIKSLLNSLICDKILF